MKRFLITGGHGFIGSSLANSINGHITVLSRSEKYSERVKSSGIKRLIKPLAKIVEEDLRDIDIIFHCASTVDNYNILSDPFIDVKTNLDGTIHLLEACKNIKKKPKIIYLSTYFVYGNVYERVGEPVTELSPTEPLALYPATKLCAESIIKLYSRLYGIPYIICRLTNTYGENEDFRNKKKGALNYLIMKIIKNEPIDLYNSGKFLRDYIYVDDVVAALLFLEKRVKNDLFLVGYGKSELFSDIVNYTVSITKSKSKVRNIEPPEFHKVVGITNFVADTSKINELGWNPKIDFREGVRRIVVKNMKSMSITGLN